MVITGLPTILIKVILISLNFSPSFMIIQIISLPDHTTVFTNIVVVKLQSSLTVQSKSVGLEVDFVFPPTTSNK